VTELQFEAPKTGPDNRRSLMEVMEFLVNRGASTETIRLAMIRAGITKEVARVLSQCVASPETVAAHANAPAATAPARGNSVSSRSAKSAPQNFLASIVMVALLSGVGAALGFSVGMERGLAQGLNQLVKAEFIRVVRLASLRQAWK